MEENTQKEVKENTNNTSNDNDIKTEEQVTENLKEKESFTKKIKDKKKKIDKEKDELIKANLELKEKVLRITAEMQNMRRRSELDIANLCKYEGFDLVEKLLPILDNFERALNTKIDGADKFLSGFKMIYDNLINILNNKGIKEIEVLHKEFDPNIMNAVMTEENKEFAKNIVLEVLQKGYMYNDRLIRPAMVKVNERND